MGLFSGKTIISVASSVYNLAGDEKDRPNYLQSLIVKNILSDTKSSLGDDIPAGYLHGPGIKFRTFFRWALKHYDLIGMPDGNMYAGDVIQNDKVADHIPHTSTQNVWVQDARIGDSDYSEWAEQWMIDNYPALLNKEWDADFDDLTHTVKIKLPDAPVGDGSTHTFVAADFQSGAKYIFAHYTLSETGTSDPVVTGTPVSLGSAPFPDISTYGLVSNTPTDRTETLSSETTVVKTYSDGRPAETSHSPSSSTETVTRRVRVYDKRTYLGNSEDEDAKVTRRDIRRLITDKKVVTHVTTSSHDDDIGGGVTRTTTTIVTEDELEQNNSYRDDTQTVYETKWDQLRMWIYRIGSGVPALDNLISKVDDYGKFFPIIPFRLDNKFVSELAKSNPAEWKDKYELAKRAFKKGTNGGKYTKVEGQLADSEDLKDMDYIYTHYGVSLNCLDKSARRYIYEFFLRLMNSAPGGATAAAKFRADMLAYNTAYQAWIDWRNSNNGAGAGGGHGGYVGNPDPEPPLPAKPSMPEGSIHIRSSQDGQGSGSNFDVEMKWNFISSGDGNGLGRPKAKRGDLWIVQGATVTITSPTYVGGFNGHDDSGNAGNYWVGLEPDNKTSYETTRIYWQYQKNKFKYIEVGGLQYINYVYGGKSVKISAKEALEDGEESGFLVPLHYATFLAMPLVHSTQMSTASVFLVINSYQKKKLKWWQSGFFRILFVIAIAIISGIFAPGAVGLLGSNIAVGGALGLTGMSAAIVGSVANALAALVLTTIIEKVTAKLGVFGALIGAVLGIVIGGAIQNFSTGGGFTFNFSDLMRADNIMKLMDAAGQGYSAYVQASIQGMQADLVKLQESTNAALRDIREQYAEQFGSDGGGQIDPTWFTSSNSQSKHSEARDTFLTRTLMTGTDVANMSQDLLNNMAELTLTLPTVFNV